MKNALYICITILFGLHLFPSVVSAQNNFHWLKISAGTDFCLALRSDSTLWGWGYNNVGQLGQGNTTTTTTPVQLQGNFKWTDISAGGSHGIAIRADSTLWSWGLNDYGQLGLGTTSQQYLEPQQVGTDHSWAKITASSRHSFAIKTDGTLWGWGWNSPEQFGNTSSTKQTTPYKINDDTDWKDIQAGMNHRLALKLNNTLWVWGANGNGQLGLGDDSTRIIPTQYGTDTDWVQVSAGASISFARKSNGTIWGSGWNGSGELGIGDQDLMKTSFTQIGNNNNWIFIEAGPECGFGITSDSLLFGRGKNAEGQLGAGTNSNYFTPVQEASASSSWVSISAATETFHGTAVFSGYHTIALKQDRSAVCATGRNHLGQHGNGNTTDSNTFMCYTGGLAPIEEPLYVVDNQIKAYPNPGNGLLYLHYELVQNQRHNIIIRNITGQVVWQKLQTGAQPNQQLNLTNLPKGVYLLELQTDKTTAVKRIILQ